MSISKRISEQVEKLDVNKNMKTLMIQILEAESHSTSKYKTIYEKKIENYLKAEQEGDRLS